MNRPFVLGVLGLPIDSSAYAVDTVLSGEELERVTAAVFAKGDAFLARVHDIVGHGPQSEQLDRGTGAGLGAEELTWNYASMLSAMFRVKVTMIAATTFGSRCRQMIPALPTPIAWALCTNISIAA